MNCEFIDDDSKLDNLAFDIANKPKTILDFYPLQLAIFVQLGF